MGNRIMDFLALKPLSLNSRMFRSLLAAHTQTTPKSHSDSSLALQARRSSGQMSSGIYYGLRVITYPLLGLISIHSCGMAGALSQILASSRNPDFVYVMW